MQRGVHHGQLAGAGGDEAGDLLDPNLDPRQLVDTIETRYHELWAELTEPQEFPGGDVSQVESRVRRLNALGFDVAELDIQTSSDVIRIQPKVVDAGHHQRRLLRLTGLDTEENQARRLLNDLDTFAARRGLQSVDESVVAHKWLTEVFSPVVAQIPPELSRKRDMAQFFHEVLDYRFAQHPECPRCGAARTHAIVYGMPADPESWGPWLSIGGCCLQDEKWRCGACDHEWL